MRKYRGSHEDFDYFVVPTVPALKQQQDTIATLAELAGLGIPSAKLRVVFNQVEDGVDVSKTFESILTFIAHNRVGHASPACRLGANEIYERAKGSGTDLAALAADDTDYKALIARRADHLREGPPRPKARDSPSGLGRRSRARRLLCGAGTRGGGGAAMSIGQLHARR